MAWTHNPSSGWHQFMWHGWEVEAKVYDEPSKYGIDGGRVSKLYVFDTEREECICNYDRGWDVDELSMSDLSNVLDEIEERYPPPEDA